MTGVRALDRLARSVRMAKVRSYRRPGGFDTSKNEKVMPAAKPAEVEARLAEIPADTRGYTARLFGDPLPGRSALDRERLR